MRRRKVRRRKASPAYRFRTWGDEGLIREEKAKLGGEDVAVMRLRPFNAGEKVRVRVASQARLWVQLSPADARRLARLILKVAGPADRR